MWGGSIRAGLGLDLPVRARPPMRRRTRTATLAFALLWMTAVAGIVAGEARAQDGKAVPEDLAQLQFSFAPLVKRAAPAVVNIHTVGMAQASSPLFDDPVLRQLFGNSFGPGLGLRQRQETSLGSGVIVDPAGLIVTNHHVIQKAETITVVLADRRDYEAELILADARTDLAVLRIDPEGEALPFLPMGDSDALEVGDLVVAIGNPFGVGQTVTLGIVSALARTQVGVSDYSFFIQTDAAINPGNSGGALVGTDGRLLGVNTAIYSRSGGSIGIGFAIPANMVRTVVASARNGGEVERPWAGFTGVAVDSELAEELGLSRAGGVQVTKTYPEGPADRAGLRLGDVVLAVDGRPVADERALKFRLATRPMGQTTALDIWRRGERFRLDLPLEPAPEEPPLAAVRVTGRNPLGGALIGNLSPKASESLGLPGLWSGVVLLEVPGISPARRFGFRPGDILEAINGVTIESARQAMLLLNRAEGGWRFSVRRGDRLRNVEFQR